MAIPATNFYFFRPSDEVGHLAAITNDTGSGTTPYPPALLCDFSRSLVEAKPALLATNSGSWVLSYGNNTRIDFVIFWHNGDAGNVLRFQGDSGGAWGSPTLDGTVAAAKYDDGHSVMQFIDLRKVGGYSATGFPLWRAVMPSNSVPVGLKMMAFSQGRQLNRNFRPGIHRIRGQYATDNRTDRQLAWVYDMQAARSILTGDLPMDLSDFATVQAWHQDCHGKVKVTAVIPDPNESRHEAIIGRWMNTPSAQGSGSGGSGRTEPAILDTAVNPSGSQNLYNVSIGIEGLASGPVEWE